MGSSNRRNVLTTGQLASLPSTATQFPGLANVAVPDITSATNIPIESALQSYQAPGINATQYAELQQAKALLNPAALTTPPVVPPVTPTVTPTWAGSPLNPANMGANPAFPPTTGPWNPAPVFPVQIGRAHV